MSRDALLIILAIVVLANFVFLAEVAVLNRRRTARERGAPARRSAAVAGDAVSGETAAASVEVPLGPRLVPRPTVARGSAADAGARQGDAEATAEQAAVDDDTRTERTGPKSATADAADATPPLAPPTAPRAGEPMTRRSRTRRFAMPQLDEDRGRTEAAINAFLGEPSLTAGSPQQHRPRRRSRRQRSQNDAVTPMVVVATLAGWEELRRNGGPEAASRFGEALASTLRGTLRSSDELMELGGGRLRIVVHADEEGAHALIVRATAICEPWLRAAPVKLELRARAIDPAASTAPAGAAAASASGGTSRPSSPAPLPFPGAASSRQRTNGRMSAPGEPR